MKTDEFKLICDFTQVRFDFVNNSQALILVLPQTIVNFLYGLQTKPQDGIVNLAHMINHAFKMRFWFAAMAVFAVVGFSSCQKEGEGGTSTISGKVYAFDYNTSGQLTSEYYAHDEDVFIVYGGANSLYDDNYKTSYDGSYRFQNLTTGDYRIFVYSRCDSCASGSTVVIRDVMLNSNGEDMILDDLLIDK
ncbi:MAG: hypothetical protein ACI85F_001342 [Bacteroidia bacterium]|jgi:hypothetical protein